MISERNKMIAIFVNGRCIPSPANIFHATIESRCLSENDTDVFIRILVLVNNGFIALHISRKMRLIQNPV